MTALHIETPLLLSHSLSRHSGRSVWLKFDSLQPSGSFKIRGVGHACQAAVRQGARRFISSSGGNAGIAAAYAGQMLSVPVVVVVPTSASEHARNLIREQGAEVVVHGESWQEANELALSMTTDTDILIHPFDNPQIWQGHASMIDEIANTGNRPDAIVLSVGGGGLLCGVVEGLQRNDWGDVPIVAVETEGARSLDQAIHEGKPVELDAIDTVATSLGARKVCDQAYENTITHSIRNVVISDKSAVNACNQFMVDHRVVVEPACGASLAVVYDNLSVIDDFERVLVVVCGGATVTVSQLQTWQKNFE